MQKPQPKRRKRYKLTDDLPVGEVTEAIIEVLGDRPVVAKAAKALADAEHLSLDAWLWRAVANDLHDHGVPLPRKIRKYIAEHPDMPEALRKQLLTRDLS